MKSAVILIDFINELVHEKGKASGNGYAHFVQEHNTLENLNKLMFSARGANIPVVHVRLGYSKHYSEVPTSSPLLGKAKNNELFLLESWATEFHEELNIEDHDFVITKHSMSPFYSTQLDSILNNLGVKQLFIAGVATDLAVQSAAREAHDRNYKVTVVDNCCAAASDLEHESSISNLKKFCIVKDLEKISFAKSV
jgi:nicotinamidase-related amidase